MSDQGWTYVWIAFAAWCGMVARHQKWTTPDGTFSWRKALIPAIAFMVAGFGAWIDPLVDVKILAAIGAFVGYLGIAALEPWFLRVLDKKAGV
jgi:hypothetical protein